MLDMLTNYKFKRFYVCNMYSQSYYLTFARVTCTLSLESLESSLRLCRARERHSALEFRTALNLTRSRFPLKVLGTSVRRYEGT